MAAEISSAQEERVRHTDVSFDKGDLQHGPVFGFLIALAAGVLLVHVILWGVFRYMGEAQFAGHASTNPIMTSTEQLREIGGDPAIAFPKPSLQPDPIADLNKFRAGEEEELNSYGWVDPSSQKIHIPIESAIDTMSASWPNQRQVDEGKMLFANNPTGPGRNSRERPENGGAYAP
jgi:hypothetical protein